MTTTATKTAFFPQDSASQITPGKGKSNGRAYAVIPSAHSGDEAKGACCMVAAVFFAIVILVVSAALWGVGASQGNTEMLLAGQVLTGIQITIYGGVILSQIACCGCWELCKAGCECLDLGPL